MSRADRAYQNDADWAQADAIATVDEWFGHPALEPLLFGIASRKPSDEAAGRFVRAAASMARAMQIERNDRWASAAEARRQIREARA